MDDFVGLAVVYVVTIGEGEAERFRLFLDRTDAEAVQQQTPGSRLLSFDVYLAAGGGLGTSNMTAPIQYSKPRKG